MTDKEKYSDVINYMIKNNHIEAFEHFMKLPEVIIDISHLEMAIKCKNISFVNLFFHKNIIEINPNTNKIFDALYLVCQKKCERFHDDFDDDDDDDDDDGNSVDSCQFFKKVLYLVIEAIIAEQI